MFVRMFKPPQSYFYVLDFVDCERSWGEVYKGKGYILWPWEREDIRKK